VGAIRTAGPGMLCGQALSGAGLSGSAGPAQYEIRAAGVLDSRWAAWFNDLQISSQGEEAVISGPNFRREGAPDPRSFEATPQQCLED
jgi:hypothetical protein